MSTESEEIRINLGADMPLPARRSEGRRDTVWYRRLRDVIEKEPQGSWIVVMKGPKTVMRVYRSNFASQRLNVPTGHLFECDVFTRNERPELKDNEGYIAFRYLGIDPEAEVVDDLVPFDPDAPPVILEPVNRPLIRKRKPRAPKLEVEELPMWVKLPAESFAVYCEFESTHGRSEDDIAAMLTRWEAVNGPLPSELSKVGGEQPHVPDPDVVPGDSTSASVPEIPELAEQADLETQAQPDLYLHTEDEVVPPSESGPLLVVSEAPKDAVVEPAPEPAGVEEVPSPEEQVAVYGEAGCQHDPYNKDHWWSPLAGAPPVCRFCAAEQPNLASVQQVVEHQEVAVVVQPDGRSIQEIIAASRADNGAPKIEQGDEPIIGLEDFS